MKHVLIRIGFVEKLHDDPMNIVVNVREFKKLSLSPVYTILFGRCVYEEEIYKETIKLLGDKKVIWFDIDQVIVKSTEYDSDHIKFSFNSEAIELLKSLQSIDKSKVILGCMTNATRGYQIYILEYLQKTFGIGFDIAIAQEDYQYTEDSSNDSEENIWLKTLKSKDPNKFGYIFDNLNLTAEAVDFAKSGFLAHSAKQPWLFSKLRKWIMIEDVSSYGMNIPELKSSLLIIKAFQPNSIESVSNNLPTIDDITKQILHFANND